LSGTALAANAIIKNKVVKLMHEDYEEKKRHLSGPRRAYFESELFKSKCDDLFDEMDTDRSGHLDMDELTPVLKNELGSHATNLEEEEAFNQSSSLIAKVFQNGDSRVERAEFMHMMQWISMMKFKEGNFSEDNAWEVLQLDKRIATYADIKKKYKIMALKYHPDKRHDVSDEERKRDMAEINDAKKILDDKFNP